jgi:hypothetical protein
MDEEILKLRGHHLETPGLNLSAEQLQNHFVQWNYINSSDHPFAAHVYELFKELRENPNQLVRIIDQPDDICLFCPKDCKDNLAPQDRQVARWLNLEIGKVYTSKQILESFEPQKTIFKEYANAFDLAKHSNP